MFYRPVYEHKGSTLSADSGYLYEDEINRQFFEAFGNVIITQPSGTIIYSDKLHYDASVQLATLTRNVRMVDGEAILTTNHLTYNMRSEYGTYSTGGRIINKGDTITSQNAYYYENTKDAYFRNKVIVRTPDVKIYTDSMRYNADQRITYFYGPTDIQGNNGENLYTEKGDYSTEHGTARFSENNLYSEGTKFLKGDSLYYSRDAGVGKAYYNVVFIDTLDKFFAEGGYGEYNQADESITMTDKPLITMLIKEDSTKASVDSSELKVDSIKSSAPLNDSLATLTTQDSVFIPQERVDSIYLTADTLFSKMILLKDYQALDLKISRDGGELEDEDDIEYGDDDSEEEEELTDFDEITREPLEEGGQRPNAVKNNSGAICDTLNKAVFSSQRNSAEDSIEEKSIASTLSADSLLRREAEIPLGHESDSLFQKAVQTALTIDISTQDSSTALPDTVTTRILKAFYNVRLFKSDLQAVADSVYYGEADSMFRFMGNPMVWAEESQISADTVFMQIKNQKLDNALLKNNAFMINSVLDTVKYNQLKGRKITTFFKNNSIEYLYVDGNAENLIFSVNEDANIITEMFHDRSSRIKIRMEDQKIIDYISIRKVDQKVYPFKMVNQDNEVLPGFIWRPQDRPTSKEDLLNRKRAKRTDVVVVEENTDNQYQEGEAKIEETGLMQEVQNESESENATNKDK